MKRLLVCGLIALLLPSPAFAKKPKCTFRAHLEGNRNDSAIFATPVRSRFSGNEVFIEKIPTISEQDVSAFYPYRATDGTFGVLIELNEHGKLALDTLSIEHRGKSLFVFLNGRDITELQIDRRVSDGKIYLPSGITEQDIVLMAKAWRMIGQRKK
jgi:hypothetical protein